MLPRLPFLLLPVLFALPAPVRAQDDELPPDEIADLAERYVERGHESVREGNYEEARLRFRKALDRDPGNEEAHLGTAACFAALGAYDKAEEQLATLLEARPASRAARVALARLALRQGRQARARELAEEVLAKGMAEGPDLVGLDARIVVAESHALRGRRDEARDVLDFFADYYRRRRETFAEAKFQRDQLRHRPDVARPLAEEMRLIARALRIYVELSPLDNTFIENANELLLVALELDPENWEAWIERVRVTRAEREGAIAFARKARDLVTRKNPELADLYAEVALSILTGISPAESRQMAEKAIRINPKQTDARAVLARLMLEDNQYAQAIEEIETGLAVDPQHRDLLALKATLELLKGDREAFDAGMKRVLEVDPTYGEAYHLAGLVVATRQRRYDRAVELVRRGLELDPLDFQAHATLGIFLANLGRAEEALDALEKSKEVFPYAHPIRENFRLVLDYVIETMTEHRTEHFVFRFDPAEEKLLSLFLPELMEGCWAEMTDRYGFVPEAPVLVEVFRKADDFSVRTLGLPGIPALGACFGGLITLDSPAALPKGQFQWASTARHEFAHVMSLQLSKGQVPRWFTEGLSVLEEKPLDPGWGMHAGFERMLYDDYHTGGLPDVASFDAMFRTPRVAYAYYLGGLMLEFLRERSGYEGIVKALRLYGEDRPMRVVFAEAFAIELDEFDRLFRERIGERVARWKRVPRWTVRMAELRARALKDAEDGENLLRLAWAHFQRDQLIDTGLRLKQARDALGANPPRAVLLEANLRRAQGDHEKARTLYEAFFAAGGEDYDARIHMAGYHYRAQEEDAFVAALERAIEVWPFDVEGPNSPYPALRRHYLAQGDTKRALAILEKQARIASNDIGLRLQLAREYVEQGRDADAIAALEHAVNISVYDRNVHTALLALYRKTGATKKAVRAARCVVGLRTEEDAPEAVVTMHLDLADALLADGRREEAATVVAEARGIAEEASLGELPRLAEIESKLGQ